MFTLRRIHQLLIHRDPCLAGRRAGMVLAGIHFTVLLISIAAYAAENQSVPLSLKEYTSLALKNSLRSRTAEESLASSRYGWVAAHRNLTWPTLSASYSESKFSSDNDTGTMTNTRDSEGTVAVKQPILTGANLSLASNWTKTHSEVNDLGVVDSADTKYLPAWNAGFTQPLFIFVRNPSLRARRQANIQWEMNQDAYWSDRLNIEFDARTQYYDLLLQAETTEVNRKKFESASLVNEVTHALVRAGKLAEVELVRADIRSKTDQRNIQNSENNLEKSMNNAKDLISLPNEQAIRPTSRLAYEPFKIPLGTLLKGAEDNNPGLQTAKKQVELAEIDLQQTREGDRPQLNTSGTYALTEDRSNPDMPLSPHSWTLKAGVDWVFFDATQTHLKSKQSALSLSNTKRSYENQLRQLHVSVQNAYLEIKRTEDQISDFGPQKESAERNVRAIRLQYKNGLTRLTDVFDAENQLRDLELEYLGLLVTFNTARDRIKVLVGTDLEDIMSGKPK